MPLTHKCYKCNTQLETQCLNFFSVFSEQPCFGEAREGHCSRKPSHPIGSLWTVSWKGKRKVLVLLKALMTSVVSLMPAL